MNLCEVESIEGLLDTYRNWMEQLLVLNDGGYKYVVAYPVKRSPLDTFLDGYQLKYYPIKLLRSATYRAKDKWHIEHIQAVRLGDTLVPSGAKCVAIGTDGNYVFARYQGTRWQRLGELVRDKNH